MYPKWDSTKQVEMLDVGCGYGGMLIELARRFPETLVLGMEIRVKVSDFVCDRIRALRAHAEAKAGQDEQPEHHYENAACIRTNTMKYLPNWCGRASLSKMFFLFPDPHFKKAKRKWRILNRQLLAEYAYVLRVGGVLYTATDVRELHEWMVKRLSSFPLFVRLNEQETEADPLHSAIVECSEEAQKVTRMGGAKYIALFRRVADPLLPC